MVQEYNGISCPLECDLCVPSQFPFHNVSRANRMHPLAPIHASLDSIQGDDMQRLSRRPRIFSPQYAMSVLDTVVINTSCIFFVVADKCRSLQTRLRETPNLVRLYHRIQFCNVGRWVGGDPSTGEHYTLALVLLGSPPASTTYDTYREIG